MGEKNTDKRFHKMFKTMGSVFLIPIMIWMLIFALAGVGIGYDVSLTFSDAYHQYLPFHSELREILLSGNWDQILYHWELGFGGSFFGVYSYYLSSPFALLALFFETTQLPIYFYIVILLKVGLSSVMAFIFFKHQPKVTKQKAMLFAILYACIGAMMDRFYNIMWLDAIMMLPLTIWTLQRLIHLKRWKGFLGCLIYLFWTNFYMAYMVGVFCFLWFCLEISLYHRGTKREKWKLFGRFMGCAGLAAGICGVLLWPTLLMLKENSFSQEVAFSETHHLVQSLADFFIGSYNALVVTAPGNIYITLFGLLVAVSFFFNPIFSKKERLVFGMVVSFFLVSFSTPVLDWVWHGFKMPEGFPNRYAFLLSFLLLYLGCRSFSVKLDLEKRAKQRWLNRTIMVYLGVIGMVLCATFFEGLGLRTITDSSIMGINLVFGILYLLFFICWKWSDKDSKHVTYLFLTILGIEIVLNGYMTVYQLKTTQYSYRKENAENYFEIETALEELEWEEVDRFLLPYQNLNASLFHNVKTLENYNTLGHRQANALLYKLYYGASNVVYAEPRNEFFKTTPSLVLDSLLGVRYYYRPTLKNNDLNQFDWLETLNSNWLENPYQLPLAFRIDPSSLEKIDSIEWQSSPLANQEVFLNALLGLTKEDEDYLDFAIPWDVDLIKTDNFVFDESSGRYIKDELQEPSVMIFRMTPPENVEEYDVQFSLNINSFVKIDIEDELSFEMSESKRVSSFDDKESYLLTLTLPEGYNERLELLTVSSVKDELAMIGLEELKQDVLESWIIDGPMIETTVNLKEKGLYWLSIPYSPNWTATINGEEIELKSIQDSFIAIELPEGEYTLSLTYQVSGLKTGILISGLGLLTTSLVLIVSNRKKEKKRG